MGVSINVIFDYCHYCYPLDYCTLCFFVGLFDLSALLLHCLIEGGEETGSSLLVLLYCHFIFYHNNGHNYTVVLWKISTLKFTVKKKCQINLMTIVPYFLE